MISDSAWRGALQGLVARARQAVRAAVGVAAGPCGGEITVLLADDSAVARLNQRFRGVPRATNVLAFPAAPVPAAAAGAPAFIGDVILARQTVAAEAAARGLALADHVVHLIIHGVLHLLGYDHATEAEAQAMEEREALALARLGIADPYQASPAAARGR
ncbi:MAG: rRNA maturation RNase YbeY [Alphaproteobacteria bacterium]|nr:rRNA maturation RNase YbeY [Alphaproteobacteria bacterium]